ncbi:MAG: YqjK-like family protein [Pirellulales bacterium]|nr:YqjK-like family protein [Pirellulales bacterium]
MKHLFAFTTVFAVLLAIAVSSGAIERDGIWVIESIDEDDWGGSWNGKDPVTGEPMGGPIMNYVAKVRDGDRVRLVYLGDDMTTFPGQLPKVGSALRFSDQTEAWTGKYYDINDGTAVMPTNGPRGYSPAVNVVALVVISALLVLAVSSLRRLIRWGKRGIAAWSKHRKEAAEIRRRTRII